MTSGFVSILYSGNLPELTRPDEPLVSETLRNMTHNDNAQGGISRVITIDIR